MRLVYCSDFDYTLLDNIKNVRRPRGNNGTLSKKVYKDLWCAFDIETTRIDDDNSIMYVWQFQLDDKCTIIGRTWDEFKSFAKKLKRKLSGAWLVVYVHNLSYEFSFLKGIYNFDPEEVFCLNGRKVLKCDMYGALEFRCSYYQNNTSLAVFARQWAKTQKESGEEFNYNKTRYPWTPLTDDEIKYIQADVVSLVEAISAKARYFGDTQITIPLTATGYIRKTVKQKMRGGFNHNQLQELLPDAELTFKLVEAFRGGNTHASRFYANQVLNNVGSYDISSAYPAAQVTELFPMTAWYKYKDPRSYTIEHVIDLMGSNKALLLEVTFYELGLKNLNGSTWGNPYISRHKCRDLVGGIYDNGRVLYAERLTTVLTDLDFKILLQEYQFSDIEITFLAASTYKKLPSVLTDYTIELFKKKTELKGVVGSEVEYRLSKERINSIYGMSVTNPLKEDVKYINGEFKKEALDFQARIEKENKKAFQSYAWGVWITAHTRYKLERALNIVGTGYVYCDTDSVKFIGRPRFKQFNEELTDKALKAGAYAKDPKGNIHYIGVFEREDSYSQFKTLGAKRYAYTYKDGTNGITIAGVNKKIGAEELWDLGGLEAFKDGVTFYRAGGTEVVYNDKVNKMIELDGRPFRLTDNACIKDSTYTLGMTGEYLRIINHPDLWLRVFDDLD